MLGILMVMSGFYSNVFSGLERFQDGRHLWYKRPKIWTCVNYHVKFSNTFRNTVFLLKELECLLHLGRYIPFDRWSVKMKVWEKGKHFFPSHGHTCTVYLSTGEKSSEKPNYFREHRRKSRPQWDSPGVLFLTLREVRGSQEALPVATPAMDWSGTRTPRPTPPSLSLPPCGEGGREGGEV